MKQENKSPEYIALSLLFYSFIIAMTLFAVCRALNIGIFANGYISIDSSELVYHIITKALHLLEGFLILKILTKLKWYYALSIALVYTVLVNVIGNVTLNFLLDVMYIINVPFIFNENKEQSILHSVYFILGMSAYQLLMSFGRYDVSIIHKYDLGYAVLSFIDYKLFLITIKLYQIKRRK